MSQIYTILFDLDGTLVDTAPDLIEAHNHVMKKFGHAEKKLSDIKSLAGKGAWVMMQRSFKEEIKDERIKNLMQSIDNTNYRYGRSTISLASAGINKKWSMRRQYSSKIDTADFYSLPKILAN